MYVKAGYFSEFSQTKNPTLNPTFPSWEGNVGCHTGSLSLAACKKLIVDGWISPEEKCLLILTGGTI